MPYKIGDAKANYFNKSILNEAITNLELAIGLERRPVGIKFIYSEEEYDNYEVKEVRGAIAYCKMVELASRGMGSKSTLKNHNCDGGTTALGLEESSKMIETGQTYFSYGLYKSLGSAKRMRDSIVSLHEENSTYGMLILPLAEFEFIPDVVIVVGNPYQIMRMTQGYTFNSGNKPSINYGAMQAMCSELTVTPYLTGEINISAFCPSTRMLSKWKKEEMAIGIPFEQFISLTEGVMDTIQSTEIKSAKLEIIERFKANGIDINLDASKSY